MIKVKMALILFSLSAALSLNGCGVTNVIKKGKNAALAIKEDYGTFANCDEAAAALSKKIVKAVNDGSAEKIKKLYAKGKYDGSVNDLIKKFKGQKISVDYDTAEPHAAFSRRKLNNKNGEMKGSFYVRTEKKKFHQIQFEAELSYNKNNRISHAAIERMVLLSPGLIAKNNTDMSGWKSFWDANQMDKAYTEPADVKADNPVRALGTYFNGDSNNDRVVNILPEKIWNNPDFSPEEFYQTAGAPFIKFTDSDGNINFVYKVVSTDGGDNDHIRFIFSGHEYRAELYGKDSDSIVRVMTGQFEGVPS